MTTAPRGGGPRSMGASLLDQVLAETLDPAYEQAARARAERERAGIPEPPARRRPGRLAVALTLALAGLLAGVTYNEAAAGEPARAGVRAALVDDIMAGTGTTDRLAADLERLRDEVAAARDGALAASAVGQRALDAVAAAEAGAAVTPLRGPGLLVTLADAEPDADGDPLAGAPEDPRGQVRDGDLQLVVNALWAAGAEGVSINGHRLGPTTAIRFAGEAVLVDFRPVTNPYLVSAVGDPGTLRSRFLASPEVASLAVISRSFGLRFEFAQEDQLTLPAAGPPELRAATPLAEEPAPSSAAPGAATGGGG